MADVSFLRARNEQDGKRALSRRRYDMHTPPATRCSEYLVLIFVDVPDNINLGISGFIVVSLLLLVLKHTYAVNNGIFPFLSAISAQYTVLVV